MLDIAKGGENGRSPMGEQITLVLPSGIPNSIRLAGDDGVPLGRIQRREHPWIRNVRHKYRGLPHHRTTVESQRRILVEYQLLELSEVR